MLKNLLFSFRFFIFDLLFNQLKFTIMKTKYSKTKAGELITIEINNDCFSQFQSLEFTEQEITRWAKKYSPHAKECSRMEGNEDGNYTVLDFEEYYEYHFDNDLKDFVAYFFGGKL